MVNKTTRRDCNVSPGASPDKWHFQAGAFKQALLLSLHEMLLAFHIFLFLNMELARVCMFLFVFTRVPCGQTICHLHSGSPLKNARNFSLEATEKHSFSSRPRLLWTHTLIHHKIFYNTPRLKHEADKIYGSSQ